MQLWNPGLISFYKHCASGPVLRKNTVVWRSNAQSAQLSPTWNSPIYSYRQNRPHHSTSSTNNQTSWTLLTTRKMKDGIGLKRKLGTFSLSNKKFFLKPLFILLVRDSLAGMISHKLITVFPSDIGFVTKKSQLQKYASLLPFFCSCSIYTSSGQQK